MFFDGEFAHGSNEGGGGVVVFGKEAADGFVVVVGHFADVVDAGQDIVVDVVVQAGDGDAQFLAEFAQGHRFCGVGIEGAEQMLFIAEHGMAFYGLISK